MAEYSLNKKRERIVPYSVKGNIQLITRRSYQPVSKKRRVFRKHIPGRDGFKKSKKERYNPLFFTSENLNFLKGKRGGPPVYRKGKLYGKEDFW